MAFLSPNGLSNSFLGTFHARQPKSAWGAAPGIGYQISRAISQPTAAAAPTPVTYTPPPAASQPDDPIYNAAMGGATKTRDISLTGLYGERDRTLGDYGYAGDIDPTTGAVTNLRFDPTNPFSRAALLRHSYETTRRANSTGMAARGQLYSGALVNAQNRADRGFNQGENDLQRALIRFLATNAGSIAQAKTTAETAMGTAEGERIIRAPSLPGYDPAALAAANAPVAAVAPVPVPGVRPFNPFVNLNPWRRR